MESVFELRPSYQSPAQKEQSERNRRRFMRRRAILRWVMRTFRLYR